MSHEMRDLLRDDSQDLQTHTTPPRQVEQQPSELVCYLRGLNEWLEWDVHDRRAEIQSMSAHLERTHNKVIPLLNWIVQAMELWREGAPPGAVRLPSDHLWDVISPDPSTTPVAPTVSAVSTDKTSSSPSSSPGGNCPGFPSLQYLHPPQLSVNMGRLPLGSAMDRTLAPSLTKTAVSQVDPPEVGIRGLVVPEQNDMVRTQLRDVMKLFVEHKDEIARKDELAEERWAANQARWEDKHTNDAATHNMLERILASQAEITSKLAIFKDEVVAELRVSSVSSADRGVTEPLSLRHDVGPQTPSSRSSTPEIVGYEQRQPGIVRIPRAPTASGRSSASIVIQPPPSVPDPSAPDATSRPPCLVQSKRLCTVTTPPPLEMLDPTIIPSGAPGVLSHGAEDIFQVRQGHRTSSASSSRSSSPARVDQPYPVQPSVGIIGGGGGPRMPYTPFSHTSGRSRGSSHRTRSSSPPQESPPFFAPRIVPVGVSLGQRTPSRRTRTSSRSPTPPPPVEILPSHGFPPPAAVRVQSIPPPLTMPLPIGIPTLVQPAPSRAQSPVRMPLATAEPAVIIVPRSPSRSHSPLARHRPRSPYDPYRPCSPYDPPYGPRHGESGGAPRSDRDPYEEEWRSRPHSRSSRRARDYDDRYQPRYRSPGYYGYPCHYRYRPRSPDSREGDRPHSRDSREGRQPHLLPRSRPHSPEYREGTGHASGMRQRPRSRTPEYDDIDIPRRGRRPLRPRSSSSEYQGGDHRPTRSRDSRDSYGSPQGYRSQPTHDDRHGRPSTSHPSHPRTDRRVITAGRPTTAVHQEREPEPEDGAVYISPPSEPSYEHAMTPPPTHRPHILESPVTEGDAGEHSLLLPHRVPPCAPSAADYFHKRLVAGPEHLTPTLPHHAGSAVAGPSASEPGPAERGIGLRSLRPTERIRPRSPGRILCPVDDERSLEEEPHPPEPAFHKAPAVIHPESVPPPILPSSTLHPLPIPAGSPPWHNVPPAAVPAVLPPHAAIVARSGPSGVGLADAEQERQDRFEELAGALDRTVVDLQDGEGKREQNYRANEEERMRVFIENERKRDIEAEQRLDAMWKKLEDRLAALPAAKRTGSESSTAAVALLSGESVEGNIRVPGTFEPSTGPQNTLAHNAASMHDAASQHAADIREAIRLEREAAQAERERALELNEATRNRMLEEHRAHICALEDELSAVRKELVNEKMARAAEEAGRSEQKRVEMLAQNDMMRCQMGDLIGLLLDRRDAKAIGRRDDEDEKRRGGLMMNGPRLAYVCLGVCLYSVFLVGVWG